MDIDKQDWDKFIYGRVTDKMLTTPVKDLSEFEVELLRAAFSGPYGQKLVDRLDALNDG